MVTQILLTNSGLQFRAKRKIAPNVNAGGHQVCVLVLLYNPVYKVR